MTVSAPKFTAAQPQVADWCEGVQVPFVPFTLKTGMPGQPLRTGQLLQIRPPRELEQPPNGPGLILQTLKEDKGGKKIKFLKAGGRVGKNICVYE